MIALTELPVASVPVPPLHPVKVVAVLPVHVTVCAPRLETTRIEPAGGKLRASMTLIVACGRAAPFDAAAMVVAAAWSMSAMPRDCAVSVTTFTRPVPTPVGVRDLIGMRL